ncbi:hypothetical protein GCM10028833_03630 [Glycomyces tarimensis]
MVPTESAVVAATETGSDAQGGAVDDPDDSEEEAPEEAESPIASATGCGKSDKSKRDCVWTLE